MEGGQHHGTGNRVEGVLLQEELSQVGQVQERVVVDVLDLTSVEDQDLQAVHPGEGVPSPGDEQRHAQLDEDVIAHVEVCQRLVNGLQLTGGDLGEEVVSEVQGVELKTLILPEEEVTVQPGHDDVGRVDLEELEVVEEIQNAQSRKGKEDIWKKKTTVDDDFISYKETTLERAASWAGWSELSWIGRAQPVMA